MMNQRARGFRRDAGAFSPAAKLVKLRVALAFPSAAAAGDYGTGTQVAQPLWALNRRGGPGLSGQEATAGARRTCLAR
jgi:hypothetical protein